MLPNPADTLSALQQLPWVEPTDAYIRVAELRKRALALLLVPVVAVVSEVWAPFIPAPKQRELHRQLKKGLRYGIAALTVSATNPGRNLVMRLDSPCNITAVPYYWEPPVAVEPELPRAQLQAYRWTAAVLALWVRNHLERLHGEYTDDDCMPALNQGVRAASYRTLLENPYVAWELSFYLRVITGCVALKVPGIELPLVAGT